LDPSLNPVGIERSCGGSGRERPERRGWISAGICPILDVMKSAYELAMERLGSQPARKLTDAQKAELAELDSIYAAKLAQEDLSTREAIQAAQASGDLETVDLLRQRYAAEKAKIEAEREAKKDRVRGA
jgi:hypothetical protein